jgi:hypothetical protein
MRIISPCNNLSGRLNPGTKIVVAKKQLALFVENNWKDLIQSHRSHFNQFSNFSGQILVASALKSKPKNLPFQHLNIQIHFGKFPFTSLRKSKLAFNLGRLNCIGLRLAINYNFLLWNPFVFCIYVTSPSHLPICKHVPIASILAEICRIPYNQK